MSDNPSAFPSGDMGGVEPGHGMTLRDWFAGQVLAGRVVGIALHAERMEGLARQVYELADAMLAERAKVAS